eukprot:3084358-Prymnesium_polylepis.1
MRYWPDAFAWCLVKRPASSENGTRALSGIARNVAAVAALSETRPSSVDGITPTSLPMYEL